MAKKLLGYFNWIVSRVIFIFTKIKNRISKKILLLLVLVVAGAVVAFLILRNNSDSEQYVTSTVTTGTISNSISVSGNLLASTEGDLKFDSDSDLKEVYVKVGDTVKKDQALAKIDDTDLQNSLTQAQIDLDSANNNLSETIENGTYSAEDISELEEKVITAQTNLELAYMAYDKLVENTDTTTTIAELQLKLDQANSSYRQAVNELSYAQLNTEDYTTAVTNIQNQINDHEEVLEEQEAELASAEASGTATEEEIDALNDAITATEATIIALEDDLVAAQKALDDYNYKIRTLQEKVTSTQIALTQAQSNYDDEVNGTDEVTSDEISAQEKIRQAHLAVNAAQANLDKAKNDPTTYSDYAIASLQQKIKLAKIKYDQAVENLDGSILRSSADGIITYSDFQVGSSSTGKYISVYDPNSLYLDISLTEYEVAEVELGMKATIAFSSLNDKEYIGELSEISLEPDIQSNVVSYSAKIAILANDGSLKKGLTGEATITLESKSDVLIVPTAAITSSRDTYTIKVLENGNITEKTIEIGLASDTQTEVTSGLTEGETIVVSIIDPEESTSTSSSSSSLQQMSGMSGMTGMTRSSGSGQMSGPPSF